METEERHGRDAYRGRHIVAQELFVVMYARVGYVLLLSGRAKSSLLFDSSSFPLM